MSAAHQYAPLTSSISIRLVQILPAVTFAEPIRVQLHEASLDSSGNSEADPTEYIALSYCWGSAIREFTVTYNGKQIWVTKNCDVALRYLRKRDLGLPFFIDAISINQQDADEKSAQVQCMGDVYRHATSVIIWLGEAGPKTAATFLYLHRLCRPVSKPTSVLEHIPVDVDAQEHNGKTITSLISPGSLYIVSSMLTIVEGRFVSYESVKDYVRDLLSLPYWHRIWTVQEIAFSSSRSAVMCGEYLIAWTRFSNAANIFLHQGNMKKAKFHRDSRGLPLQLQPFLSFRECTITMHNFSAGSYTLSDKVAIQEARHMLVQTAHAHEASTDIDRVYGLYALFRQLGIDVGEPNYQASVETIYIRFTRDIIKQTASLATLDLLQPKQRSHKSLPSWVHDFRCPLIGHDTMLWTASKGSLVSVSRLNNANPMQLPLEGMRFDVISGFNVPCCPDSAAAADRSQHEITWRGVYTLQAWLLELVQRDPGPYPLTGEDPYAAFYHTLTQLSIGWDKDADVVWKTFDDWLTNVRHPRKLSEIPWSQVVEMTSSIEGFANSENPQQLPILVDLLRQWETVESPAFQFLFSLACSFRKQRFLLTRTGYYCIGPEEATEGDTIVIFAGANMPMVVRQDGECYRLIGPISVYGVMSGEVWSKSNTSDLEVFTLV